MTHQKTFRRRDAIGALFVGTAVAASVAGGANAGATQGVAAMNMRAMIRPETSNEQRDWDCLLESLAAAKQAAEEFRVRVFDPCREQLDSVAPYVPLRFDITARSGAVVSYDLPYDDLHAYDDHMCLQYRVAAKDCREGYLARQAAAERLGYNSASDEYCRLDAICAEIENDLMTMPAPDATALWWKLDQLFGPSARDTGDDASGWAAEWIDPLMADAERLLTRKGPMSPLSLVPLQRGS